MFKRMSDFEKIAYIIGLVIIAYVISVIIFGVLIEIYKFKL